MKSALIFGLLAASLPALAQAECYKINNLFTPEKELCVRGNVITITQPGTRCQPSAYRVQPLPAETGVAYYEVTAANVSCVDLGIVPGNRFRFTRSRKTIFIYAGSTPDDMGAYIFSAKRK